MTQSPSRPTRLLLLALICGVAILFRFWRIDALPPGFHFDESFEALEAWRIYTDSTYRPIFLEGNFGVAPLNAYVVALGFAVGNFFGIAPGPTLMRGTIALAGVLTVLATYSFASELRLHDPKQRLSAWFPLFSAAALAIMRWHVHFSRMGIEPIWTPLEWLLGMWALLYGWRTNKLWAFAAAGAIAALSLYTYQGAWVLPFVLGAVALGLCFTRNSSHSSEDGLRGRWKGLAFAGVVALLLAAPLLHYFATHADLITLRPQQVNVVGETASPADAGLLTNTIATAAMYLPIDGTGDMDPRRNIPGEPALNLWLAIPFWIGVVLALWRIRDVAYWSTLLSLAGLLSVGVFTEYAPHFHRILGAVAPTAILCAVGLDWLWQWRPKQSSLVRWLAPLLILLAAIFGWRDYFVRWAALPDLYHAFDEGLWQVGNWIADQPADTKIYLSPRDASHPTLAFAWQTRAGGHGAPVTFDGRSIFPVVQGATSGEESYISITHEDFRTPLLLPDLLPYAVESQQFVDWSGAPYATIWTRPAGTQPSRPPYVERPTELGDGIRLWGYDAQPAELHPGETLYVQLHWLVDAHPAGDWTVFVHLRDPAFPNNPPLASKDSKPGGGSLPTLQWQSGWRVLDEYQIALPANLPAGTYEISVGMYDEAGSQLGPITLGEVTIE